jgi:hypothetical protein
MLLIYDPKMASRLKEGQATDQVIAMRMDQGRVTAVDHAESPDALRKLLETVPAK